MKTLFLLRHAKSSWKDKNLADFERPLSSRGRRASETMSALLKQEKVNPDLILSSPAVRARETVEIMVRAARLPATIRFDERIYEASATRLLEVVSQIEKEMRTVLLVGHNPGFEELITALTGRTETMPTAALAKITSKVSNWANVIKGGTLEWVVRPKELEVA
jgi:phosphohistidine phosphatase